MRASQRRLPPLALPRGSFTYENASLGKCKWLLRFSRPGLRLCCVFLCQAMMFSLWKNPLYLNWVTGGKHTARKLTSNFLIHMFVCVCGCEHASLAPELMPNWGKSCDAVKFRQTLWQGTRGDRHWSRQPNQQVGTKTELKEVQSDSLGEKWVTLVHCGVPVLYCQ